MNISNEIKSYVEPAIVQEWINNNWFNEDLAEGVSKEINSFIHSLIEQKVGFLMEGLGQMIRSDLKGWAMNKNSIVEDKIRDVFGVE